MKAKIIDFPQIRDAPEVPSTTAPGIPACVAAVETALGPVYGPLVGTLVGNVAEDWAATWPMTVSVTGSNGFGIVAALSRDETGTVPAKVTGRIGKDRD